MDGERVWAAMRSHLQQECLSYTMTTWFDPLRLDDYRIGLIRLNTPSALHAEWMRRHYMRVVHEAADRVEPGLKVQYVFKAFSVKG